MKKKAIFLLITVLIVFILGCANEAQDDDKVLRKTEIATTQLGESAFVNLIDSTDNMILASIRAEEIIKGNEATEFVNTYGRKKTPTEGTTFVVLKYSTDVNPREYYIDCKFLGLDGENIISDGKVFVSRCYDVYSKMEERDGQYTDIYLYYEVPIGINEYMLVFGCKAMKDAGAEIYTANYIIKE